MYVLSIVRPPVAPAAFGQATVLDPVPYLARAAKTQAQRVLVDAGVPAEEASEFGLTLSMRDLGTEWTHTGTGLTFRIDPEDRAPNACPCCGRLVNWQDHALAGSDDAYCLGCFTWERGMTPCLPENSAHTEEENT